MKFQNINNKEKIPQISSTKQTHKQKSPQPKNQKHKQNQNQNKQCTKQKEHQKIWLSLRVPKTVAESMQERIKVGTETPSEQRLL